MSIIKNDSIKRGDLLKSAELNAEFTAVNSGFPMNGDNVRNEGVDYMAGDTLPATGKNGLVLVAADKWTIHASGASALVREYPTGIIEYIGEQTGLSISAVAGDILRVYWQAQVTTTANAPLPSGATGIYSTACWAHWLEWDVGAGYVQVPGQSGMNETIALAQIGAPMDQTLATSLVHACIYYKSGGSSAIINPGARCSYGSYFYKFTGGVTIAKFRIACRGVFLPKYNPVAGGTSAEFEDRNCLLLDSVGAGAQQIVFNQLDLKFLLMRSE